jgi:FKBP-type peptidyl-prolyl cis-trans isomerase
VRPGEGDLLGLLVSVLIDGDEGGDALAFGVLTADDVAGAFRGHHDHVHVLRRDDGLVENGEAVGEEERFALGEVGGDVLLVHATDLGVRHGDEDDVGGLHGFSGVHDLEALFFGHGAALGACVEADDDFDAALLEVQGVGVALGAEADDGAGLAFERCEAGVFFSVDFRGHIVFWFRRGGDSGSGGDGVKRLFPDTQEELMAAMQAFEASMQAKAAMRGQASKAVGDKFLADNGKRKGVTTTASGLQYEVIKAGDGPKPAATDKVNVHYHGTLIDGKVFDSSVERGQPITFGVQEVIKGWTEALQLMPVGSKWKIFIPSQLAYGEHGAGGDIGPNEALDLRSRVARHREVIRHKHFECRRAGVISRPFYFYSGVAFPLIHARTCASRARRLLPV